MGLLEDIEMEIQTKKLTKAELLLQVQDEIQKMLDNGISLKRQIELLLKNKILEKISLSEYKKILTKHFDYTPKFTRKNKAATSAVPTKINKSKPTLQKEKLSSAKDAKEFLSQEISLY